MGGSDLACKCENFICTGCGGQGHGPLGCEAFKAWEKSLERLKEKLTSFWKKSHTKDCPKCGVSIEKDAGCMHVTCCQCSWNFCWMCLGKWEDHGSGTGGYYKCNIYKEDPETTKDAKIEEKKMKKLEFYIDRYMENKQSFQKSQTQIRKLVTKVWEKKPSKPRGTPMYELRLLTPDLWDFYLAGLQFVIKCRNFICFTYALAFNIKNGEMLELYAENQWQLANGLEKLEAIFGATRIEEFICKKMDGSYGVDAIKLSQVKNEILE